MENATQFGIYKILFFVFCCLNFGQVLAQDYYVDLEGNKHDIEIQDWNFDKVIVVENGSEIGLIPENVKYIYRDIAGVYYLSIDSLLNKSNHQLFFIPSIESIKALSIDNFRDENFEVWVSGQYIIYNLNKLGYRFEKNQEENIIDAEVKDVFIFHEDKGFYKIVSSDIDEEDYKLLISKFISDKELIKEIFQEDTDLKPKKFLSFFDKNISPLNAVFYNDKDMTTYSIHALKEKGALVLVLNLNKQKIDLYRSSGNEKIANNLEAELLQLNISFSYSFLDSNVFNFCDVYIIDASNRTAFINGKRDSIFLNKDLEIDESIVFDKDFYLFLSEGVYYETQLAYPNFDGHKKMVTSTPVQQDVLIIKDIENTQLLYSKFQSFIRIPTASFMVKKKVEKNTNGNSSFSLVDKAKSIEEKSGLKKVDLNAISAIYSMNIKLHRFYNKTFNSTPQYDMGLEWNAKYYYVEYDQTWRLNPFKKYSLKQ